MHDSFVPLHDYVARPIFEPAVEIVEPAVVSQIEEPEPLREAFGEVRRFRAAVCDAVEFAVDTLLCDIAAEVLARELKLAPANIDAIVSIACARFASESIVRVRTHPDETAEAARSGAAVVADPNLRRGDALLEVRAGTIDVTLGTRLASILDR